MADPGNDEILKRLKAQTLRVLEEAERRTEEAKHPTEEQAHRSDSLVDQPWFVWMATSCAIAVGATLALLF